MTTIKDSILTHLAHLADDFGMQCREGCRFAIIESDQHNRNIHICDAEGLDVMTEEMQGLLFLLADIKQCPFYQKKKEVKNIPAGDEIEAIAKYLKEEK